MCVGGLEGERRVERVVGMVIKEEDAWVVEEEEDWEIEEDEDIVIVTVKWYGSDTKSIKLIENKWYLVFT